MICNKCGQEIREDAVFCTSCGSEVQKQHVHSKKSGKLFFVILGILILVLIAGIFVLKDVMEQSEQRSLKEVEITGKLEENKKKEEKRRQSVETITETETEENNTAIAAEAVVTENVDDEAAQSVMQNQLPEDLDVEKEVEHIRDLYYGTQECIDSFSQEEIDGITYFFDGNELVKMIVPSDIGNSKYTKNYYFEEGKLYFAFIFEGLEEHRFYFKEDCLIRYIDSSKTMFDYGTADMDNFNEMTNEILAEAYDLVS